VFDFMDFDVPDGGVYTPGPSIPEPADCMRCGLCLSECPTYRLTHDEQEGPRQRIRTLSRLVIEQQAVGVEAVEHLQNCLQCRACETVCPSKMDYAELFDQAQAQLAAGKRDSLYARIALSLIAHKKRFNALLPWLRFYQLSGLRALSRKSGLLKAIGLSRPDRLAPAPALTALKSRYPAPAPGQGTVALFTGCVGDRFDRATLKAAIEVLNRIGFDVLVPEQQACCGAIHYHHGAQETAKQLMRKNVDVFNALPVDAIVYCATGCGSQLQDYSRILELDEAAALSFHGKLYEITDFVDRHWPASLALKSVAKKASVHEPCSQRNVLKNQQAVYRLLGRIPGLELEALAENHLCCGAGGSYMLTHPDNADALRDLKWRHLQESDADYLVTSNIGCALHLASAEPSGRQIQVLHPIELIAHQLMHE